MSVPVPTTGETPAAAAPSPGEVRAAWEAAPPWGRVARDLGALLALVVAARRLGARPPYQPTARADALLAPSPRRRAS